MMNRITHNIMEWLALVGVSVTVGIETRSWWYGVLALALIRTLKPYTPRGGS